MKFKSQICTTREQSDRLLKLGLKAETADMTRTSSNNFAYDFPYVASIHFLITYNGTKFSHIEPAWSLHRLIEIAEKSGLDNVYIEDNWYDEIIAIIQSYIHLGYINKEYLNMDIVNANEDKNVELLKNGGE